MGRKKSKEPKEIQALPLQVILWGSTQGKKLLIKAQTSDCLVVKDTESKKLLFFPLGGFEVQLKQIMAIAYSLKDLPSAELMSLAYTKDLESEWKTQRSINQWIGKSFITACLQVTEDEDQLQSPVIVDVIEMTALFYRSLWDLIRAGFPYIKKNIPNLPFETPSDLTVNIIEEERNSYFEILVTNDYIEFFNKDLKENLKSLPEGSRKFPKALSESTWLPCVLGSLRKEAKSKRKIQALFEIYDVALRNLREAFDELLNDRSAQGLTAPSHLWKYGEQWFFNQYNQPTISLEEKKVKLNKT